MRGGGPEERGETLVELLVAVTILGLTVVAVIGGLATIAPTRRAEIVELGPRTIVSGTLATCLLGAVVGVLS